MKKFIDYLFRLLVAVSAVISVYILSSVLLAPPPYEAHLLNPDKVYVACPGQKIKYDYELLARRTPVTLMRTDTWFSEKLQANVVPDKLADTEAYNWDKKVTKVMPVLKTATVPLKTSNGLPMPSGNYRYIVNLNSWGVQVPASMSIKVKIPENCS